MPDAGFIHDIGAMGVIDWFRLGGLLATMAITYAIGMGAGYAKAAGAVLIRTLSPPN